MTAIYFEILKLVAIDALFIAVLAVLVAPLIRYKKAAFAVLARNFVGYFANPTGYVFLCLFVFLSSAAAFWPHEFFIANLANLDQLNKYMPLILLVFIPAITMSLWADERRQGTDELLLTLPAADFDIVIGKYLAAAAIFTVSLIFSQICNYWLLVQVSSDPGAGVVDLDTGLFFVTYLGYWLMGLAMLAVGMVASFLTPNLTVSFILGMLFNAILVMTNYADVLIPASAAARDVSEWSFAKQFDDFGRGVISLSSTVFFVLVMMLGIYLSMVLIGKRHWLRHDARPATAGQKLLALVGLALSVAGILALAVAPILRGDTGTTAMVVGLLGTAAGLGLYWAAGNMAKPAHNGSMAAHFIVRALTLVVLLIGVNILLKRYDRWRYDATQGHVSSLSPDTKKLLREISKNQKRPVNIEAFISTPVPEEYVETRYSLVSTLKELERQSGGKVRVALHQNIELFSDVAAQADQRFGIQRQRINTQARGALKEEEFIMGVAFTCGLEKVVLPSFKLGMPVEYELIRSIATVAGDQRKRLGVVNTEAQMMGGFSMAGMQPRQIPKQLILDELEKQYKVDQVDPANPIDLGRYDVLLIVQPSSLGPPQLANVVEAIKQGQPAVVFEDPHPIVMPQTVGTAAPNPSQGGMFGMGGQSAPKGDIRALWNALEIQVTGDEGELRQPPDEVVWQKYNPYPRFAGRLEPELVFIRDDMPDTKEPFNREVPAVSHFEEVLFPTPTGVTQKLGAKLKMTDLVSTSDDRAGTIEAMKFQTTDPAQLDRERGNPTKRSYTLAAWIRGEPSTPEKPGTSGGGAEGEAQDPAEPPAKADAKDAKKDTKSGDGKPAGSKAADTAKADEKKREINVIYVGDIDCLSSEFVRMRNEPNNLMAKFRFDNVPFVLNLIDAVAGEDRYFEIRKRKPKHSTLRMIELKAANARAAEQDKIIEARKQFTTEEAKAEENAQKVYAELKNLVSDLQAKQQRGEEIDRAELEAKLAQLRIQEAYINRQLAVTKQRLERARDAELAKVERERDQEIQRIQNDYKIQATVLPPILPLLAGVIVWAYRRIREREGVSRTRMRT